MRRLPPCAARSAAHGGNRLISLPQVAFYNGTIRVTNDTELLPKILARFVSDEFPKGMHTVCQDGAWPKRYRALAMHHPDTQCQYRPPLPPPREPAGVMLVMILIKILLQGI